MTITPAFLQKRIRDSWEEPRCLVEGEGGQLNVNEETIELLSKVTGPIAVVGVAGLYRSGKSYLLNVLAGQPQGKLH